MEDFISDIIEYKLQNDNGEEQMLNVVKFNMQKIPVPMKDSFALITLIRSFR